MAERQHVRQRAVTHPHSHSAAIDGERHGWYQRLEVVRWLTPEECLVPCYFRDPDWTVRDRAAYRH